MDRNNKRRSNVFFTADIILMVTAFVFACHDFYHEDAVVGVAEGLGGIIFLSLAILVMNRPQYLKPASWILVLLTVGFILGVIFFFDLSLTNLIWLTVPYFLSMFLLGLRSGMIISSVFFCGILLATFVWFRLGDDALTFDHQISIVIANLFAFTFAAYYEKARSENEKELLEKNREIEIMSHHDGLTGLFNRRYFDLTLNQEFHRARRERQPLALIILDIDFFKNYNDTFGHLQGDTCLSDVAEVINSSITRTTDTATRYGGEEFAVLLPNTNIKGVMTVAERIKQTMEDKAIPHPLSSVSDFVTLSLGVAVLSQDEDREPADLIRRADRALYASKANGRNRITNG